MYYIKNIVRDRETGELIELDLNLDDYCKSVINKIFSVIYQIEELTDTSLKDYGALHSTTFDIIGLIDRIPKNTYSGGESNERL